MSYRRFNYLDIGEEPIMKERLFIERYSVWDKLFPMTIQRQNKIGFITTEEKNF